CDRHAGCAALSGEPADHLGARELPPRSEKVEQRDVLETFRFRVREPRYERGDADASRDPYLARGRPAFEAPVRPIDLRVHAGHGSRDELARVVAERADHEVHAAVAAARDRERMGLAEPVLLHPEEA